MAFDHLVDLLDRGEKAGEVDLPVVLQRDLGKDRQRLTELADIDLRRIAVDIPFLLQLLRRASDRDWATGSPAPPARHW